MAFAVAGLLVPDREVGRDLLVGAFQPHRHIRAVVFGHVELGHFDVDVEGGSVGRRGGQQAAEGDGQGDAHGAAPGTREKSVDQQQGDQQREHQAQADQRPGHAPLPRMQVQQEQAGR
ncbi:hypothetical protein G6F50_017202 [Rhizopus delemar]|uniref:Uncharacterized protein n=1 Tax=Rhizopus delemar TaxID=936053 RepID=A0A9P6XQN5_9FUNG|nr:hypothetical protein G6F50_017202 [Rhizopus delemar]